MTTTKIALIVFGFMALGFIIGVLVGAIISGGLDETIERRKNKKNR